MERKNGFGRATHARKAQAFERDGLHKDACVCPAGRESAGGVILLPDNMKSAPRLALLAKVMQSYAIKYAGSACFGARMRKEAARRAWPQS